MGKIKLKEFEPGNKNKLFFVMNMMSGDADAYEDHIWKFDYSPELKHINFTNLKDNLEVVQEFADKLAILAKITDVNDKEYLENYSEVEEKHGEWMANMYDNLPGDVTCCDRKASLEDITLVGYSPENVKHIYEFRF